MASPKQGKLCVGGGWPHEASALMAVAWTTIRMAPPLIRGYAPPPDSGTPYETPVVSGLEGARGGGGARQPSALIAVARRAIRMASPKQGVSYGVPETGRWGQLAAFSIL